MGKVLDMKVHHYRKMKDPRNPAATVIKLVKTNPYVRFSSGGEILFVQGGKVMFADGVVPEKLPAWAIEQMGRMDVECARECGVDIVLAAANVGYALESDNLPSEKYPPGEQNRAIDEGGEGAGEHSPMVAGD